ncbi:MAG: alpha/beta fold hydrolase [Deltaproteobacteria bacterium]|nr:alpha/beta fold hydrolase [Deltaproteobacteria bacterium]
MKRIIFAGLLIFCLITVSLFLWSSCRIASRERYTGQQLAKDGEFIKVGEVNTHYIRKGNGKPLVLIHGIFSSSCVWRKNIDELSKHFDVIAVDLKGYGYSDKPADGKYSREDFRQAIKNAVVKIIPNCGHNPQEEKPEEVNELIIGFSPPG